MIKEKQMNSNECSLKNDIYTSKAIIQELYSTGLSKKLQTKLTSFCKALISSQLNAELIDNLNTMLIMLGMYELSDKLKDASGILKIRLIETWFERTNKVDENINEMFSINVKI